MARIDGKYEELRELARFGDETLLEVRGPEGEPLRLGWFDVSTPGARAGFHRYRADLKALGPAGLIDVVARPGAYYSLWRALGGEPLAEFLDAPARDADSVDALRSLAGALEARGYALQDAEIVMNGGQPALARLAPAARAPEQAAELNAPLLARLQGGKLRRRPARKRARLSVWSVLPGLLFLGAAGYLGARAAQIYLNPAIVSVPDVAGLSAASAAEQLVGRGFRVAYADGERAGVKPGSVIGQSPEQGSALHAGRLVTLTINNPPALTVPKVEELTLDGAKSALAEARLGLGEVSTVDGDVTGTSKGRVVAQLPEAGAQTVRGQKVNLLVSGGVRARQTWLPDLRGLAYDDARDLVRKAGLVVAKVQARTSDSPENSVVTQAPAPYAKVDVGSPVTLTLARAPLADPAESVPSLPLAPPATADTPPAQSDPSGETPQPQAPSTPTSDVPASDPAASGTPPNTAQPGSAQPDPSQPGTSQPGTPPGSAETGAPAAPATGNQTAGDQAAPPQSAPPPSNPAQSNSAQPNSAQSSPAQPSPAQPSPAQPDSTPPGPTPSGASAPAPRTVQLDYTFPADLPSGKLDIVVSDLGGERVVLSPMPSAAAAGNRAEGPVQVRGPARFSVRVNGQEIASFVR